VVKCSNGNEKVERISVVKPDQLTGAMVVAGGTAWMFYREEMADQFDLLVVNKEVG